jgi:hypothetical protein
MEADVHIDAEPGAKIPNTPHPHPGMDWYAPGPVAKAFLMDDSFICGIMGPFGSGKSVTAVMKLLKNVKLQCKIKGPDGWARRRTAIIRNTYPELRTTTMNTFFQWIPKHLGHWRDAGPPCLTITDRNNKFVWEILFVALDRPDDLKKLLSMELSDAWMNEAREQPKAILDGLTGRVGRFPAMWQGGCVNPQVMMDTNPPDTDHWWYVLAERDTSNERNRQIVQSMHEAEENLRLQGFLGKDQRLFQFYRQPGGRSPAAENLRNLRAGYYEFLMAGKDADWVKVYVDGEYGFVMDGLPVYPEYKDATHSREFPVLGGLGFRLGFDFGLTPAATLSQRAGNGRWLFHMELVSERMGIVSFAKELARKLKEQYPTAKIVSARGDPAGDEVTPEENTCFQILRANGFPDAAPAPTNDPVRRREGMAYLLSHLVDGEPAVLFNKRMSTLRKGMAGGFHRRRIQVVGDIRYTDHPVKNHFSHVVEAAEYDIVSGGEDRNVTTTQAQREAPRQQFADADYDVFGGES